VGLSAPELRADIDETVNANEPPPDAPERERTLLTENTLPAARRDSTDSPVSAPGSSAPAAGMEPAPAPELPGVTYVEPIAPVRPVPTEPSTSRHSEPSPAPSAAAAAPDFEGLSDDDPPQRRSRDLELELVGEGLLARSRQGLSAGGSPLGGGKPPLSPNLIAALGALLGIITVASIIAIAMRLDHSKTAIEAVPSAKPEASVAVAPAPEPTTPPKRRQREKVSGPYRVKDSANDPQLRVVEGQVGFDPFLKAVEKAGVPLKEAYRLLVAFEKVRPLSNTSRHDKFVAALDRTSKRLKAFEYITGPEEIFQAKEGGGGLLVAEKLDLKVKRERVTGAFAVSDAGLERAVTEGTFEPQLLRSMREALIGHLSLEEIERGSRVRVIAQEVTALGEFARYAGIEALEILFPSDKKRLRVYFFNGAKSRGYFDETARAPYEGGWRSPIPNAPVTSKFNMHRMHPILHKVMPHTGVDFGAGMGVPIGACSFGTITFLGWGGPTGNFIRIEHSGGVETGYAHMSRFAEGLKVGDKVKRLQTIGYVGSTGRSTGPHLHFTVKRDGKFIDPLSLNLDALRVLPSDEREVFQQQKAQYDAQLDAIELPPPPKSAGTAPAAPTAEGFDEEAEGEAPSASASAAVPPPAADVASPNGSGAPAPKSGSALYLTDEELLRMQKSSESGEVEQ
jgi:murein DD-endopeptidase MepM/ murein hydrolase activator NlpD